MLLSQIVLVALAACAWALPLPQSCGSSIARRTTSGGVDISTILTTDPCLPSTVSISSIDSTRTSTIQSANNRVAPESFSSWIHKVWDKIRNAVKSINIKITIPWDTLVAWINKLADAWSIAPDPDNSNGVIITPPPGMDQGQALHWIAQITNPNPPVRVLPGDSCGGPRQPGKPVKMCQ